MEHTQRQRHRWRFGRLVWLKRRLAVLLGTRDGKEHAGMKSRDDARGRLVTDSDL